ncbi:MAG TPA: penicillin-binding transpeptidase domain-containing protein [Humisphaera sp.]|jgi:penicillin-binding protein 2|nr:penicillin-binding transpeptidase domain-containing protein [Humisphaera sp.]
MFERRLKIFLGILAVVVCVLLARAAQVQVLNRDYWRQEANSAMRRSHLTETTRGAIKDRTGRVLAIDAPCVDACVDYAALTHPADKDWIFQKATDRLRARFGEDAWKSMSSAKRKEKRDAEIIAVQADIDAMWAKLAAVAGQLPEDIEEIRESVIRRVQMRQRFVLHKRLEEALKKQGGHDDDSSSLKRLLSTDDDSALSDDLQVVVYEQKDAHVIVHNISTAVQNELGKNIDHYPGLVLRPGTHRFYPYADAGCHLLGSITRVNSEETKHKKDELRDYLPNDLIGRTGIEALCEPALRGSRGRIERVLGEDAVLEQQDPTPGRDVKIAIDIELQQQIQGVFSAATVRDARGAITEKDVPLHGAAVVLDVKTNQVLALVSYPTFDANRLDELYQSLYNDHLNEPLRNRATMSAFEPGSTVKPLCGMAGIMAGVIGVNEGIECTGFLKLDGKQISNGRCWVASTWLEKLGIAGVSHHQVPYEDPHKGHDGNQDGYLTYSDGLQRSCNVFFETTADRLKIDGLSEWYGRFGLGRITGLGIAEVRGRLPNSFPLSGPQRRSMGFFAGIGQGWVAATPIQMANAAAMLARGGIWMRPQILVPESSGEIPPVKADAWHDVPERVDLHLDPAALAAARDGMWRVVNTRGGTGTAIAAGDKEMEALMICGKTGTAQAHEFQYPPIRGKDGQIMRDEQGRVLRPPSPVPSKPGEVNPEAPWYRADANGHIDHSWYIGYAPRDNPQVAFCVLVEYGGSGGGPAASVAREALEACITRGYLKAPQVHHEPPTVTASASQKSLAGFGE